MNYQTSEYYQNFKIFFTFFLFWFSIQFGNLVEDLVAYFMVITIGILHGANDLLLLSTIEKNKPKNLKNIIIYLLLIVFCVLIFYINSKLAILLFVLISAYHFGEEQLENVIKINEPFKLLYFFSYGMLIFAMLFYSSFDEVNKIMMQLTKYTFVKNDLLLLLLLSIILNTLFCFYFLLTKKVTYMRVFEELFYLILLHLVFQSTSLILGFAVYFIFWHSLPSIIGQIKFLSGEVSTKTTVAYVKKAIFYWLLSIAFMFILYYFIPSLETFATVIFAILFAVTAPHIWVIYRMKN